ncbi:DUF6233 domain-containing protein [Streptomyces mobaraensis]|uniref:Uncharacterized protein n=1 Tax=Streptomyces mobaraensis TaxID=35621 RepID=A0A5N5VYS6_STRMB|nr:DUF6233 domain-containing protein [Streptomyces mobaraensis]KAB7832517.1 hypothetical protein FRZ00_34800 [Streptomyces mobaraensis]
MDAADSGPASPAPRVWVELPGEASVLAELLARIRQRSGEWWCEVRLDLWAQAQRSDGTPTVEPSPTVFPVPARLVTPIEGTDYTAVPTRRPGPAGDDPAGESGLQWSYQELPTAVGRPQLRILHHETCFLADAEPHLTLDQARRAVAEGAEPCTGCGVREKIRG